MCKPSKSTHSIERREIEEVLQDAWDLTTD